ncbi:hypothetical protein [uncultured Winogradskyella sp.]|uniref:hypothetical protein n=1 Tax=uncultured Winogradskyella sp. TaxID=395353 RepID=UPI00261F9B31|nr:hypothetical protein [uncultured Winogradskyella sp.]
MRNEIVVLVLLILGFTSCEGRKSEREALLKDIQYFKKTVTIEVDDYKPATYIEQQKDTILSNGYRVKIKTFSDMDNSVLFTIIRDTINYQTYYRNYKFEIQVEKDGQPIYKRLFDKNTVNKVFGLHESTASSKVANDFNKLGVLKSIELNDGLPNSNGVKIDILYAIPETDNYVLHTLHFDDIGRLKVKRQDI